MPSADFVSAVGVFVTSAGAAEEDEVAAGVEGLGASDGITETVAEEAGAVLEGEGFAGTEGAVVGAVCEAAGASAGVSLVGPPGEAGACSGAAGVVTAGEGGASSKTLFVVIFVLPYVKKSEVAIKMAAVAVVSLVRKFPAPELPKMV